MPAGASPRETRRSAARTFSACMTLSATLVHTPSFTSAALPYLPAGTASTFAIAKRPSPKPLASPNPCLISIAWALLGSDQHDALAKQVGARVGLDQVPCGQIIHPIEVG